MCSTRYFQSILVPTLRFAQKAVVVCKFNVSSISTQQIVYSANLEYNLYRACFPWQMHYDWKIECLEVENAYIHTWMAYLLFHNFRFPQRHLVAQVAFRAEVPPVVEEVRWFRCASSGSPDSLLYHFGMEGSRPYDFVNHCRVSSHRSLHLVMPRKLNSLLLLFSDFGARLLN